jgi:hypothetical protein
MAAKFEIILALVDQASSQLQKVSRQVNGFANGVNRMLTAGFAGVGVYAVTSWANKNIEAYKKQAVAVADLQAALGRTGKGLQAFAEEQQKVTTFSHEDTIAAMARIGTFVKEDETIKKLIPLVQDLAAAKKIGLVDAAEMVTRSLESSRNSLQRYGIQVTGAVGSHQRLDQIMKGLAGTYGGWAQAVASTDLGKLEIAKNQINEMQEAMGKRLLPLQLQFNEGLAIESKWLTEILTKIGLLSKDEDVKLSEQYTRVGEDLRKANAQKERLTSDYQKAMNGGVWGYQKAGATAKYNADLKATEDRIAALTEQLKKLHAEYDKASGEKPTPMVRPDRPDYVAPTKKTADKGMWEPTNNKSPRIDEWEKEQYAKIDRERQIQLDAYAKQAEDYNAFNDQMIEEARIYGKSEAEMIDMREQDALARVDEWKRIGLANEERWQELRTQIVDKAAKERENREKAETTARVKYSTDMTNRLCELAVDLTNALGTAGEDQKEIMLAVALVKAAAAAVEAIYTVWANPEGEVWYKIAMTAVAVAEVVATTATQISAINAAARGTSYSPGGLTLVGEEGPELVNMPRGSQVHTTYETSRIANNYGGNFNPVLNFYGNNTSAAEVKRGLELFQKQYGAAGRLGYLAA